MDAAAGHLHRWQEGDILLLPDSKYLDRCTDLATHVVDSLVRDSLYSLEE